MKIKEKTKEMRRLQEERGITLVALIITIIVLVILAAVSIAAVYNSKIVEYAINGAQDYTTQAVQENQIMRGTEGIIQSGINRINEIVNQGEDGVNQENTELTVSITQNGTAINITKSNLGQYLGRVVDYTPSNPGTEYGTSTTYKLFYIDYDNKYGDGAGTIYLKAEHDGKTVQLSSKLNNNGTSSDYTDDYYETTDDMAVMKKLNPEWAKTTDATTLKTNGYASWWIADPTQWTGWKDNTKSSYINYVVGSPSLEMYVDSYNAYLTAHPTAYPNGTKSGTNYAKKLECKYSSPGYKIGLVGNNYSNNSGNSIAGHSLIASSTESMYNPGSLKSFWLASPSARDATYGLFFVDGYYSYVYFSNRTCTFAVCPLVSLKSNVPLSFK